MEMCGDDILWQVVFLDGNSGHRRVEGLFRTEEEACERRDMLTRERQYEDSFDIYPKDNDWTYCVRSITRREVMEARKKRYDELMETARERFWNHCDDHFAACCREMLRWLAERIGNMSAVELRRLAKEEQSVYAPWQNFHGDSKVFAFVHLEKGGALLLTGQFAGKSLCGTIYVGVRRFDSSRDFLEWIADLDGAATEFVSKMREQRCEDYENILSLPF